MLKYASGAQKRQKQRDLKEHTAKLPKITCFLKQTEMLDNENAKSLEVSEDVPLPDSVLNEHEHRQELEPGIQDEDLREHQNFENSLASNVEETERDAEWNFSADIGTWLLLSLQICDRFGQSKGSNI